VGLPALANQSLPQSADPPPEITFEAVYAELFSFVWRTARRLGIAEGSLDDVCQEVFVAVHRGLPGFAGRSSLRTWVFAILQNSVKVHRRTLARKSPALRSPGGTVDASEIPAATPSPDELVEQAQALSLAHAILDAMTDEKRAVFVLVELEQWSVVDAAEALGANVNTVHARLRAARRDFAEAAERIKVRDRWRTE
jgi:RNA polymerase sigma-70 factor, ECF subfamily